MISFASLNYGIIFLLLSSKQSHSQEIDFLAIENNLINLMSDIRTEVISLQNDIQRVKTSVGSLEAKSDCSKIEENLISSMKDIRSENAGWRQKFYVVIHEMNSFYFKLSGVGSLTSFVLEKLSSQTEDFKEILNKQGAVGGLTNLVLEKISSQTEDIKEILNKQETLNGNDTNLNGTDNIGTNKTESLNATGNLTNFAMEKISSQYEEIKENLIKKDLPKSMEGHVYFLTPIGDKNETIIYCENHAGKPFIPKTQEEFVFYVSVTAEPNIEGYSWYPVNDTKEEGHLVLQDGTDYESSIYKLEMWDPTWLNDNFRDCVIVSASGEASWWNCLYHGYALLCQGK